MPHWSRNRLESFPQSGPDHLAPTWQSPWRTKLNSVYITAGVVIILALLTALVGPFFVDWTAYRSTFESYAEEALGHKVTVLGKADMSLLPAPTLTFTDVRVGEAEDPLLIVSRFQMRVELPPLLKGEIRVLDMRLERPQLTLAMDEYGRLDWLTDETRSSGISRLDPKNIAFDQIEIDNGSVVLLDARDSSSHKVENVNVAVSARSLKGPFKVDGSLIHDGKPYSLRLNTGERQADGLLRLRADLVPALQPVQLSLDGSLKQEAGVPGFDGKFLVSSVGAAEAGSWRAEGQVLFAAGGLQVPAFDLRIGPEERAVSLKGDARVELSAPRRFEISASAKQVDLDRIFGEGPQKPVALSAARDEMLAFVTQLPVAPMPGMVRLDVPAIVVGGGIIQSTRLDLETALGGWRIARLASRLPGRTDLATQGEFSTSRELSYSGALSLNSEQPQALMAWLNRTSGGAGSGGAIGIDGRVSIAPDGWSLTGVTLDLAGARAVGSISFEGASASRGKLAATLDASRLDFDELAGLSGLLQQPEVSAALVSSDISLRLSAKDLVVRGIEGKALSLAASLSGDDLTITSLSAADFAGARIEASGSIENLASTPSGLITAAVDAKSLAGIVALAEDFAPAAALTQQLSRAADHLVPALVEARLEARGTGDGSETELRIKGTTAGAELDFTTRFAGRTDAWRTGDVAANLELAGPDAAVLLRQLGLDVDPDGVLDAGAIDVGLNGRPAEGMALSVMAKAGTARVDATGELQVIEGAAPRYTAAVKAKADDLAPIALLWGKVLPVLSGEIGADFAFDLVGEGTSLTLSDIKGRFAGVEVLGRLAGDLHPGDTTGLRRMTGALDVSALDLRAVSELLLGADQWLQPEEGGIWPKAPFGSLQLPQLDLALDLRAGEAYVSDDVAFSKFTSKLRLKPDLLRLEAVEASLAEGRVSGQATLTRSGPEASLSGTVQVSGARLEDLVWRQSDRAVATGSLDLAGEFQGSGRSISALVASLAGGGTLQLADAELRSMNPAAFDLVIRAADAGLALEDDKIRDVFASQLDSGPLALKRLDGSLALNGGRIALRNVAVDAEAAGLTGQALINLNDWTVESDLTLKVDPGSDAVAGAEPQAALLFTGPLSAPERDIDVAPFTAFLTLRSFEQEVQRVERLQAEILERDRLMREVKYFREETLRRQQERAASLAPVVAPQPEAPAQGQSPATTPAPAAPARTEAKPEKASDAIGDLLNFETKIRSTLDASRPANAPANLLPLEPAREVGAGLQTQQVLESGDPLLNTRAATTPAPVAATPSQRARQETAAPQAAPVQRGPRYVTDPNGLVITYPAPRN